MIMLNKLKMKLAESRLVPAYEVLRGRPVMYRMDVTVEQPKLTFAPAEGTAVRNSTFTGMELYFPKGHSKAKVVRNLIRDKSWTK